jgi:hypothetical protein
MELTNIQISNLIQVYREIIKTRTLAWRTITENIMALKPVYEKISDVLKESVIFYGGELTTGEPYFDSEEKKAEFDKWNAGFSLEKREVEGLKKIPADLIEGEEHGELILFLADLGLVDFGK